MLLYFKQNLHAKTGSAPGLASQTCDVCVMGKVPACALSSWSSALLGARAIATVALSQSLVAAKNLPASALSFPSAWQHGTAIQAQPHFLLWCEAVLVARGAHQHVAVKQRPASKAAAQRCLQFTVETSKAVCTRSPAAYDLILQYAKLYEPGSLGMAAKPCFGLEKLAERAEVTAGAKVCQALESVWLDLDDSDKASPQSCSHLEIYIVCSGANSFVKPNMLVQRNKAIKDCLRQILSEQR